MSKIINVGRVTSYADAVAGGYTGTREQWEHDLANLGTVAAEVEADRAEVAENTATVAEDKAAVEEDKSAAESAAGSAAESAESAHTDAIAATAAKEAAQTAQRLAENAASTAANAKDAAQTAQGAAEDAQTAAEAAQTAAEDAQTAAAESATAASESATAAAESEATAQHIADMYPTDKTLSVVDKAADGKATGNAVADLKSAISKVVTISEGDWEVGSYNYPNGANYESTSRIRLTKYVGYSLGYLNINALTGYEFSIYAWNASTNEYVGAWMTSNTFAKSGTLKWVSTFDLSDYDGYIVKIALRNASSPTSTMTTDLCVNCTFNISEIYELREDVLSLENITSDLDIELKSIYRKSGIIAYSTNTWNTSNGNYSYIIPIDPRAKTVTIDANATNGSVFAMLTNSTIVNGEAPSYAFNCKREFITAGTTKEFEIPSDAAYFAVADTIKLSSITDFKPVRVIVKGFLTASESEIQEINKKIAVPSITHEPTTSIGQENIIRRCRQLTDIKWTPAFDLPRISQMDALTGGANAGYFEDVFLKDVEYTGIPYGQATHNASDWGITGSQGMKPGWTVGFDTFISAVSNKESVVAKESVYTAAGATHIASFYATVCTALCGYALDLPIYYSTSNINTAPELELISKVSETSLEDIELGDMLLNIIRNTSSNGATHGAIVTDKLRDSDGNIIAIELSEATTIGNADWNAQGTQYGGICRRRMWAIADFVKWSGYTIFRHKYIENVTYNKSAYVDTGNEGNTVRVVNFPVLPYMGENFQYVSGHIQNTKILTPAYKAGLTDKLRVKKDGANWHSGGTTDYYDVDNADYIEVGFSETGTYEAYLCHVENGEETIKTKATHWTVV